MESMEGQVFEHYKKKGYRALGIARPSEGGEDLVVYETLYPSEARLWARPLSMFVGGIDLPEGARRRFAPAPGIAPGEDFLRRWLDAWSGNRPELLLSFYHPEAFYSDPAHPQGLKGKETLGAYFKKLLARYPDWKWELEGSCAAVGGKCFMHWRASLGGRTARGLDLVEVKDGLINRNEVYFDPRALFP